MSERPSMIRAIESLILIGAVLFYVPYLPAFARIIDPLGDMPLFADFTRYFYRQGNTIGLSPDAVHGYFYSVFFATLLSGVARFPPNVALSLWIGLLALLQIGFFFCGRLWVEARQRLLYLILFLFSMPLIHNLRWAQVGTLLNLCVLASYILYERDKKLLAALAMALPIAIKFYPVIFLAPFLFKRDFRFVLTCIGFVVIFFVCFPIAMLGVERSIYFQISVYKQFQEAVASYILILPGNQGPGIVLWRILGVSLPAYWINGPLVVLLLSVLARLSKRDGFDLRRSYPILCMVSVWITPTCWTHYYVFLPLALTLLLPRNRSVAAWSLWGIAALTGSVFPLLALSWLDYVRWGGPCLAGLATFGLILHRIVSEGRVTASKPTSSPTPPEHSPGWCNDR